MEGGVFGFGSLVDIGGVRIARRRGSCPFVSKNMPWRLANLVNERGHYLCEQQSSACDLRARVDC